MKNICGWKSSHEKNWKIGLLDLVLLITQRKSSVLLNLIYFSVNFLNDKGKSKNNIKV